MRNFRPNLMQNEAEISLNTSETSAASLYLDYLAQIDGENSLLVSWQRGGEARPFDSEDIHLAIHKEAILPPSEDGELSQLNIPVEEAINFTKIADQLILEEERGFGGNHHSSLLKLLVEQKSDSSFIENSSEETSLVFRRCEAQGVRKNEKLYHRISLVRALHFPANQSCFFIEKLEVERRKKVYQVFPSTKEKSSASVCSKDIVFGRLTPSTSRTRDFIGIDRKLVSRTHARLLTKYYFSPTFKLKKKILFFFADAKKRRLSIIILSKVVSFLKPIKGLYLQDLGSKTGTFVRLKPSQTFSLKNGTRIKLGSEAEFKVLYMNTKKNSRFCSLLKILEKGTYGFVGFESSMTPAQLSDKFFIALRTKNCSSNLPNILFLAQKENEGYLMGRGVDSNVIVNISDISRTHCEIFFEDGNWLLRDGGEKNNSFNGTWVDLQRKSPNMRCKSEKRLLLDNDEIQISDTVFKIRLDKTLNAC